MDVTAALEIALKKLGDFDPRSLKSTLIMYREHPVRITAKDVPNDLKPSLKNLERSLKKRGTSLDDFLQRVDSRVNSHFPKWSFTFETGGILNVLVRVEVCTKTGEAIVLDSLIDC